MWTKMRRVWKIARDWPFRSANALNSACVARRFPPPPPRNVWKALARFLCARTIPRPRSPNHPLYGYLHNVLSPPQSATANAHITDYANFTFNDSDLSLYVWVLTPLSFSITLSLTLSLFSTSTQPHLINYVFCESDPFPYNALYTRLVHILSQICERYRQK